MKAPPIGIQPDQPLFGALCGNRHNWPLGIEHKYLELPV
jgi:hypothetical protein